ncbi:hypothetical protein CDL12_11422 [Handroanthus impetiginosus]|uniref:Calmodulin-binding domain-containing protein n=1 Tax=Handroanthus impetiginosus TaxID=429701 RepID=A0A2G9HF65_9LAMI|nr:hypothetical protein CDL12_11422 [Handroanthus impetiginosus]
MTTRTRESGAPGKEKRGTSPSNVATTTQRRRSPIPSKTNSPARNDDSEKRIPNYLKPTLSSGLDVSKQQGKKPVSTSDSSQKPTLARRRSFDKPPSPSRTQKTRVSPNPTLRSSSFSGKVSTSQKVVSDRNLKGPKDVGKQHTLYARPVNTVKKGITGIKKQETRGGGSSITKEQITSPAEKVHNLDIADIPEPETKTEDQELITIEQIGDNNEEEAKDLVLEHEEPEEGVKDSVSEDQEQANIEKTEAESDESESQIATSEPSTNSEIQDAKIVVNDASIVLEYDAKTEEQEEKPAVEELEEVEEQNMNEVTKIDNTDENVAKIEDAEQTKQKQQQLKDQEEEQQQEATELNKKEEAYESEEMEKQEVVEQKVEEENAVPRAQVVAHGKKDSAVSNDVIEETANKLREQRKNKVKALAGAFETVISLQESK